MYLLFIEEKASTMWHSNEFCVCCKRSTIQCAPSYHNWSSSISWKHRKIKKSNPSNQKLWEVDNFSRVMMFRKIINYTYHIFQQLWCRKTLEKDHCDLCVHPYTASPKCLCCSYYEMDLHMMGCYHLEKHIWNNLFLLTTL